MKVPSYLQRAVEPWTKAAGPIDFDGELEKLHAATEGILARGAGVFERAGPSGAEVAAKLTGEAAASSARAYERSGGHGAYAVRAGAGLPPSGAMPSPPSASELHADALIDPGELSPEEEAARNEALGEHEGEEPQSHRDFVERAAWRNYKSNRYRARVEADRFRFGEREEMVVARRFDDMYRRNEEDYEFELLMRDRD